MISVIFSVAAGGSGVLSKPRKEESLFWREARVLTSASLCWLDRTTVPTTTRCMTRVFA